ncbi:DNA-directed DNA polymerase [Salvia divinorum]|uniref:DNA polymerase epsilon catalytic subunit n=1 Tax=Salvia divinorum TaxID=28513 RepID=A0ABD1GIX6_SALDI
MDSNDESGEVCLEADSSKHGEDGSISDCLNFHISEKLSYMNAETIDVGEGCSEYTLDSGILKRTVDVSSKPDFLKEQCESDIGFNYLSEGEKLGWLLTFASSYLGDRSCVDLYFICQDGSKFKVKHRFRPYFYVAIKDGNETDVEVYLRSLYGSQIEDIEIVKKEGFDGESNHAGLQKSYLKISFVSVKKLMIVKKSLVRVIGRPKTPLTVMSTIPLEDFVDCTIYYLCESDVPYHIRFAIDKDIRCGQWYDISVSCDGIIVDRRKVQLQNPELHTCAFHIYTTELRLEDPDVVCHSIMMISYMIDGQGYLIINREYVGEDLEDFEYTPKPEFKCCFKVKYVKDEKGVLSLWFAEMKDVRPSIYVTYKGDCFDWPFLETKAANHGYNMNEELGFRIDKHKGECHAKFACHLDCFAWVKRDSHQPKRKQGLKSVANALLGLDPVQDIAKDLVCFARHSPHRMASYYVSDVVSTYNLYMTHVHPFIFSLSTIIPMPPDEVLREKSAVVFERLLMAQAYRANVIYPNKQQSDPEIFHPSQLLLSKHYVGGNIECLENSFYVDAIRRFWNKKYAYKGVKVYRPGSLSYNVDHLSVLPMDIIKLIIAKMDFKSVVRTSCVAVCFRNLWTLTPRLDIIIPNGDEHSEGVIRHIFASRGDRLLTSFSLAVYRGSRLAFAEECVHYALQRNVLHFKLFVHGHLIGGPLSIPSYMNSVVSLNLSTRNDVQLPQSFCFPRLVSLSLHKFIFSSYSFDAESGLISLCPCIEELILNECGASIDLECVVVKSLSLKRRFINVCLYAWKDYAMVSKPSIYLPGLLRLGIFHGQYPVCEADPIFNNLKTIKFTYNEKFLQNSFPTDVVKQLVDEGKKWEGVVVFNGSEFVNVPKANRGVPISFLDLMLKREYGTKSIQVRWCLLSFMVSDVDPNLRRTEAFGVVRRTVDLSRNLKKLLSTTVCRERLFLSISEMKDPLWSTVGKGKQLLFPMFPSSFPNILPLREFAFTSLPIFRASASPVSAVQEGLEETTTSVEEGRGDSCGGGGGRKRRRCRGGGYGGGDAERSGGATTMMGKRVQI